MVCLRVVNGATTLDFDENEVQYVDWNWSRGSDSYVKQTGKVGMYYSPKEATETALANIRIHNADLTNAKLDTLAGWVDGYGHPAPISVYYRYAETPGTYFTGQLLTDEIEENLRMGGYPVNSVVALKFVRCAV